MTTREKNIWLRPMRPEEFTAFRESFIEDWALDLARAEDLPLPQARQQATKRTDADLRDGLGTAGHSLYVILADDEAVGTLWFSVGANGCAFLDDITVNERFRGNGYGGRALELAEAELKALGVPRIQLQVYAHNPRARALYQRLGYEVTGIKMSKRIDK